MKRVIMHIDRLVLNGYAQNEGREFAAQLQAELGQLLAEPGASARLAGLGHARHLRVELQRGAGGVTPDRSGSAVARAIVGGLKR